MSCKRIVERALLLMLFGFVATTAWAGCGTSVAIKCSSPGQQNSLLGTLGTDIKPFFWQVGTPANNSGTLASSLYCISLGGNSYYVWSNWQDTGVNGCPGTTPTGARMAFVYDSKDSSGNGEYILMSIVWDSANSSFDFAAVNNGNVSANVETPIAIPALTITGTTSDATNYYLTVTWTPLTSLDLTGFYDTAPPSNEITSLNVRYAAGASAPASDLANYPSIGATVSTTTSDPGKATVTIPRSILAGNSAWLRLFPVYEGGVREAQFGGAASVQVGPTPAGVFAGFDAKLAMGTVTATWRSNAESGLAFYQVYTSKLVGGPYVPINGTLTSPMGDSHVYTATFPFPKEIGKRKVFLKVKATDTDGTEWWTQPVKVARRTAP